MGMVKLFKCAHCGNIIEMVEDKGMTMMRDLLMMRSIIRTVAA